MTHLNWVRIVLGGLVAGLIMNVSGILLAHFVLGPEYVESFKDKVVAQPEWLMFARHLGIRFWFGLLAVFIYAGFRPRFGPGPRTAAIAGAIVFLAAGVTALLSLADFGLLAGWKLWVAAAWTLAESIIAALAGASIYREAV